MRRLLSLGLLVGVSWFVSNRVSGQEKKGPPAAEALPPRALERLGTSKFRQGSRVLCLAYSPNGRILAAGGGDDPVRLWDVDEGKLIKSLPEAWVQALVFSPRGSVVVTAGTFKTIRMWETVTGKEVNKLEGHKAPVKALAISPDGQLLASGDSDGNVLLWELLTARIITTFKGHTDEVTSLAFSPDSSTLASGSADRTIRFWDVDNGKPLRHVDGGCMVAALAFTEPKILASGGDDNLIRFWNIDAAKQTDAWKGHEGTIGSLEVTREKKTGQPLTLISGANDGTIRLWSMTAKGEPHIIRRSLGDSDALTLTRNGDFLATGGANNTIRVFETASLKEMDFGPGHKAGIHAMAMTRDGKTLVSVSTMGEVLIWEPGTAKIRASWNCPKGGEVVLAIAPDATALATAVGTDPVRVWALDGKEIAQLPTGPGDPTLSLTYTPDGRNLVVGRRSGKVEFWDINARKVVRDVTYGGPAYAVAVSDDGTLLAASGASKVTVWNVADLKELKTFGTREEGPATTWPVVACLAFHPEGKTLALSCYDGIIRLMDVNTGKELRTCEGHTSVAYGLTFSPHGALIATASFDRTVRLWESFSGQSIAVLKGHAGPGTAVAFAKDGRSVYSGSADTTILQWDVTGAGRKLLEVKLGPAEVPGEWLSLASEDAPRAHGALWKFVGGGKDSIPFIEGSLYLVDPKHVDKLFEDLKSDVYKIREQATVELEKYGRWMEGRLQEAIKKPNTLEVQRRLERLMGKLTVPGSLTLNQERLRTRRVIHVMEQIGDPAALRVLEKLAGGAAEPALQAEAAAAALRWKAAK